MDENLGPYSDGVREFMDAVIKGLNIVQAVDYRPAYYVIGPNAARFLQADPLNASGECY